MQKRRIANETDDDEESQRSDAADVDDSLDGSNGYDPNTSYYVNRSPRRQRESRGARTLQSGARSRTRRPTGAGPSPTVLTIGTKSMMMRGNEAGTILAMASSTRVERRHGRLLRGRLAGAE